MTLLLLWLCTAPARGDAYDEPLFRQLVAYEPVPCAQLFEDRDPEATRDTLLGYTRAPDLPSAVVMRAAACLLSERAEDPQVEQAVDAWVASPDTPGYALLVAQHLDVLPEARAVSLGQRLLERAEEEPRLRVHLLPVLRRSHHPGVQALLPGAPDGR